jgi:hypothetical protein
VAAGQGSAYLLSPEQLDGAANGTADQPNLYLAAPGQPPHFVATLDPEDPLVLAAVEETAARRTGDFQVAPNGQFAAFTSTVPLTGYQNSGFSEVYRYDASSSVLDCASCNSTNAAATGDAALASDGQSLTEDGRVFFNSNDVLTLRDTDNRQDVYEWEPQGSGTCDPSSATFAIATGDCVGLISSGGGSFDSSLLGVSSDGVDAFFFTHDSPALGDHNGPVVKIYDARTGGGFFKVPPPPPCAASDECHGPSSPTPPPPDIGTHEVSPGNVTECRKKFINKNGRCVRKPSGPRHHPHHHRRGRRHG